jgi:Ferritin-like domain
LPHRGTTASPEIVKPRSGPQRATRADVLKRAAVAGGTLAAGGVVAGELAGFAHSAASPKQDVRILNFALLFEYLTAAFYADALDRGALRGELRQFAETVGAHERAHVRFLRKALGPQARSAPRFAFGRATQNADRFVATAVTLEDTGVSAYNGQAANLTSGALAAAAKIVSVEARHAAWIRDIAGKTPAEDATDAPLSAERVLAILRRTGFIR